MGDTDHGRVLIVEDHDPSRTELAGHVAALGFEVETCDDGLSAKGRLADEHFDLLITDLDLPGADGLDLLELIREGELDTDVLVISGAGSIGTAVLAIKMGATDFLEKPVDPIKLEREIDKVFRARKAKRESAEPGIGSVPPATGLASTIGRYQIRGLIGRGAMATVLEAYDPKLDRTVAVKVIEGLAALEPQRRAVFLQRFRREAQSAARLSHANIVAVHDFGEDSATGQPYLAMERVAGVSLRQLLAAVGRLPLHRALRIAFQIADGLEMAHRHGIVHRDVKPPNVLISDGDLAKIFDFGVARVDNSELTAAGVVVGSVSYMAPEVLRGQQPDPRADQFALGHVLYEMLTSRPLFRGSDFAAAAHAVLHDPVPTLAEAGVPAPEALQWILDRLLAKDPRRRYADEMLLLGELSSVGLGIGMRLELAVPRR